MIDPDTQHEHCDDCDDVIEPDEPWNRIAIDRAPYTIGRAHIGEPAVLCRPCAVEHDLIEDTP